MEIEKLIDNWEKGEELVTEIGSRDNGVVVRVTKRGEYYSVFRYFTLGTKWTVSADAVCVQAEAAIKAISKATF